VGNKNRRQHTPAAVVAREGHTTPMIRARSRYRSPTCAGSPAGTGPAPEAPSFRYGS